jgi:integrative and conjugative element protein (TIGR02256 family)
MVIEARARHGLAVVLPRDSSGGIWDAYVAFKYLLCVDGSRQDVAEAFYSDSVWQHLFQPEPGCSDPTFAASTAEVTALLSEAVRVSATALAADTGGTGFAFSIVDGAHGGSRLLRRMLPVFEEVVAGTYRVRMASAVMAKARSYVRRNERLRGASYETGGLLWGYWDDASEVVWIFDASGPPPDSRHDPGHFLCGTSGTKEEHAARVKRTYGVCGFVGHWHTHPDLPSHQSSTDAASMGALVASLGSNQRRSTMLIFGRQGVASSAGVYIYESERITTVGEFIAVGTAQFRPKVQVV